MSSTQIRGLRWWIVALLLLATVINYVDRQTLSTLANELDRELGMKDTGYSRIVFFFMLAYTVMQSGFGRIMDRLGTRLGFALAITWWSMAAVLHATANSVLHFGIFRFLLGAGEAGNWPGGVKAVSEWFPPKERAFAIGVFNGGSCLGAVIAPPLVSYLARHFGWRAAFVVTGALGFLWLAAWLALYRLPREHPRITKQELEHITGDAGDLAGAPRVRWLELLRFRQVWGLVSARFLADPVWWFYVFWLPKYLGSARGFDLKMIGYFAWIPFLTADAGNFLGGWLSSWMVRRGWPALRARKIVMFFSAACMLTGIPAVLTPSPAWSLAFISIATFAYSSWAANILTLPADLFPREVVASVSGLSGTGAGIGGMVFQLAIGYVVSHFSYTPLFTAAGLMPLMAAVLILWHVNKPA